jgi:hypothetical protein
MRKATSGIAEDENGDLWKRRAISGSKKAEDDLACLMRRPISTVIQNNNNNLWMNDMYCQ